MFEQTQARFGDHQMNAADARIGIEQAEGRLGEQGTGSAGDAEDDDFAFC